jgi:hypothetical protein
MDKKDNTIIIDYAHPDFNVEVKLNLVKDKYASIDYTITALGRRKRSLKSRFSHQKTVTSPVGRRLNK